MRGARVIARAAASVLLAAGANGTPAHGAEISAPEIAHLLTEAHGGTETWDLAPSVSFEDSWSPGPRSLVRVEQGTRRACLELPDRGSRAAWDGDKAWSVGWPEGIGPPRFRIPRSWYLLCLPWLVHDPGVELEVTGSRKLFGEPVPYTTLRMTFAPGTGDTPGDRYVLFVHPGNWRLRACEWVATYRDRPDASAAAPRLLVYEEHESVDGLVVPTRCTLRAPDRTVLASLEIGNWSFTEPFDEACLAMPAGAVVDRSRP